jgi:glycosyltransferase involved in cell wall biosynthesis
MFLKNLNIKILFIVPFLSNGGAERVVSIWSSELAKVNANTQILVFYRVENEYTINKSVKIHAIRADKKQYDELSIFKKVRILREKIKKTKPDIILPFVSHVGIMTNIARFALNVKLVETIRIDPRYSPGSKILRKLRNISVLLATRCIVQNQQQKEYFPKWMHKKIEVFPNPIANEFIKIKKTYKSSSIKRIISVGRLEKQKNYPMLINAFSKINTIDKDIVLDIYGEGSLRDELQGLIDELGLSDKIKLCGRTDNIGKMLVESDLFILTSNAEGMPNSLMEAMAVGLACISTDCPTGPSDLIEDGTNGILIPVGDERALVDSISSLIRNPFKAFSMGRMARETILKFYAPDMSAKKLYKFLESI